MADKYLEKNELLDIWEEYNMLKIFEIAKEKEKIIS